MISCRNRSYDSERVWCPYQTRVWDQIRFWPIKAKFTNSRIDFLSSDTDLRYSQCLPEIGIGDSYI